MNESPNSLAELDKRVEINQLMLDQVLAALKHQTEETAKLNNSIAEMTTRFDYTNEEVKILKKEFEKTNVQMRQLQIDFAVQKRGLQWVGWFEKAIMLAVIGAILYTSGIK